METAVEGPAVPLPSSNEILCFKYCSKSCFSGGSL